MKLPGMLLNKCQLKNAAAASGFTLAELRLARYRMLALREKLVSSQPVDEYVEMEILRTVKR